MIYGYNRAKIGTTYSMSHTSSPLFPNRAYFDKSNIHLMSPALTIGEQGSTDLDDTELEQKLDAQLGIAGVVRDVPGGGLSLPGSGIIDTAIALDQARSGSGITSFKQSFPPFTRSTFPGIVQGRGVVVAGAGLGSFLRKLKRIGSPHLKKLFNKKALPFIEKQLEFGLSKATKKLSNLNIAGEKFDLTGLLPADKLKMATLKKLKKAGTGHKPHPRLLIHHPAMESMTGGQLGLIAGIASQFLLPALSGVIKNLING